MLQRTWKGPFSSTDKNSKETSNTIDLPSLSSSSGEVKFLLESPLLILPNFETLKNNTMNLLHETVHINQAFHLYPHFLINQEMLTLNFLKHLHQLEKFEEGKLKSQNREIRKHFEDYQKTLRDFEDFEREYLFTPESVVKKGNILERDEQRLDFFAEGEALFMDLAKQLLFAEKKGGYLSRSEMSRIRKDFKKELNENTGLHSEAYTLFDNIMLKLKGSVFERIKTLLLGGEIRPKGGVSPFWTSAFLPYLKMAALPPPPLKEVFSKLQEGKLLTLKPQLEQLKKLYLDIDSLTKGRQIHSHVGLAQENMVHWFYLICCLCKYIYKEESLKQQTGFVLYYSAFKLPLFSLMFSHFRGVNDLDAYLNLAVKEKGQDLIVDTEDGLGLHETVEKINHKLLTIAKGDDFDKFLDSMNSKKIQLLYNNFFVAIQYVENWRAENRDAPPSLLKGSLISTVAKMKAKEDLGLNEPYFLSEEDHSLIYFLHFLLGRIAKKAPQMITGEDGSGKKLPCPIKCPAHELKGNFVESCSQIHRGKESVEKCRVSRDTKGFDATEEFSERNCPFWQVFNQIGMGKINYSWQ